MEPIKLLTRRCDRDLYESALSAGLPKVAARVLAGRPFLSGEDLQQALQPGLTHLDPPDGLSDIDMAADRLARAVVQGEVIALETDHDVDGVTSHAVLKKALVEVFGHPESKVLSYVGHRLKEGYGLSMALVRRILDAPVRPSLIITADNGSSDEERIALLKREGIDVIVTDHHEMPMRQDGPGHWVEVPPPSAVACVSPKHPESTYPDTAIAGCMVAWLVMQHTREKLRGAGALPAGAPDLFPLLDYVAVGTVADCVSLAGSLNNRAVVAYGLERINAKSRPCWEAIRPYLGDEAKPVTASDIGFGIGPRINARGRLDEAMAGVHFLLAETVADASRLAKVLDEANTERKDIERQLRKEAIKIVDEQVKLQNFGLAGFLPNGHAGVHGIVASRLVEAYGRPTVCLSPKFGNDDLVSGSARCIEGFHVRDALQGIADRYPDIFVAFGGHAGAGGLTIYREGVETFIKAWDEEVRKQITDPSVLGPQVRVDGSLNPDAIGMKLVDQLDMLEPYGREFEPAVFESTLGVKQVRPVGDGSHLQVVFQAPDGKALRGIWFNAVDIEEVDLADPDQLPIRSGQLVRTAFEPARNWYRGECNFQMVVRTAVYAGEVSVPERPRVIRRLFH